MKIRHLLVTAITLGLTSNKVVPKELNLIINKKNRIVIDYKTACRSNKLKPIVESLQKDMTALLLIDNDELASYESAMLFELLKTKQKDTYTAKDICEAFPTFKELVEFTSTVEYFDVPAIEAALGLAWIYLLSKTTQDKKSIKQQINSLTYDRLYDVTSKILDQTHQSKKLDELFLEVPTC